MKHSRTRLSLVGLVAVATILALLSGIVWADSAASKRKYGTVLELPVDIATAILEGDIALREADDGSNELVATGPVNSLRIAVTIAEAGLYELKLLVCAPYHHPHYGLRPETNTTVRLAGETRHWPLRATERPRYSSAPLLVKLDAGAHTLEIENLPDEIQLRGLLLVEDRILVEKRPAMTPPFDMPEVAPPNFPDNLFNIKDYGARQRDGQAFSEAMAKAIAACHAAGGGTVLTPAGEWHTAGPIHFKSNVNIHFAEGASVFFSDKPEDYLPPVFVRWAGIEMYNYSPLLYARDCENIALTGKGRLVGQGESWWPHYLNDSEHVAAVYDAWVENFTPVEERDGTAGDHVFRPEFFQPIHCRNILIEDISFESGPFWTIAVVYCENVLVRRVKVFTDGPNGDGFCPDSSSNVIVEHSFFRTEDDAIAIHTGLNDDGRRVNRPTENVVIRHNRLSGGFWGSCALGSKTTAGIRNVLYHDNHHSDMNHAFYFKSTRGRGGVVENIYVYDLKIERMYWETMTFTTYYSAYFGTETGPVPLFRDIVFRNIEATDSGNALSMRGLPYRPFENLRFENVSIQNASRGAALEDARDIRFINAHIHTTQGPAMQLTNCQAIILEETTLTGADEHDLRIKGAQSDAIIALGREAPPYRTTFEDEAREDALFVCRQ